MTTSALDMLDGQPAQASYVVYRRVGTHCDQCYQVTACAHGHVPEKYWQYQDAYRRSGHATSCVKRLTGQVRDVRKTCEPEDVRILVVRPGALETYRGDHDENLAVHERAHVEEIARMESEARAAQDPPAKKPRRRRRVACPDCDSVGLPQDAARCATCGGEGTVLQ